MPLPSCLHPNFMPHGRGYGGKRDKPISRDVGITIGPEHIHVHLGPCLVGFLRNFLQVLLEFLTLFSTARRTSFPEDPPGPLYPPNTPSERITLWQGTEIGMGFEPQALATAL